MENQNREKTKYKLIAVDMDGTALDEEKVLHESTAKAMNLAIENGVEIVFCSGRSPTEMSEYTRCVPGMRYVVCESGAYVYDIKEQKAISQTDIPYNKLEKIKTFIDNDNQMILVSSNGVMYMRNNDKINNVYRETYPVIDIFIKNWEVLCKEPLLDYLIDRNMPVEKVNLYHLTEEGKHETLRKLRDADLNLEYVYSDMNSVEISPHGLSKATGLEKLCETIGIPMQNTVMIGDADNDLEALKVVGLPIAMGNANANVKSIVKMIVNDNEHDGCAEAILKVLKINESN